MADQPATPPPDTQVTPPVAPTPEPPPATNDRPAAPHRQGKDYSGLEDIYKKRDGKQPVEPTKKPEPVAVAPDKSKEKQVASKSTTTPTEITVESLMAEEPPEHFEEKGRSHFKTFKEKWHGLYKSAQEKVSSLEKMLADREGMTKKEVEELKTELSKAKRYEHAFDIQADPEFQKKYITPANEAFKSLGETLKRAGYDASAASQIDWDDEVAVEAVAMQLQEKQGAAVANVFRNKAAELRGIRANFRSERDNAVQNYDKIIVEKTKERELKATEREGRIKNTLDGIYAQKLDDGALKFGFLSDKPIPPGADAETRKAIEQNNALARESRQRIEQMSHAEEPEDLAQLAVAAEVGYILSHERPAMLKQIKELEESLAELQGGRTMPKGPAKVPEAPKERYQRGSSIADEFASKFKQ